MKKDKARGRTVGVSETRMSMMYVGVINSFNFFGLFGAFFRVFRPLVFFFKEQKNQLSVYTRPCCRPLARSSWSSGWPSVLPSRCVSHYLPCTRFASSERPRLFTCVRWTRACACASSSALLERTILYHSSKHSRYRGYSI